MKVIAYTALHYGKDYLAYAIRSVIDHVDEYWALYTPIGSHGHRTAIPCPETRDELRAIAEQAAGDKLRWHESVYPFEGAHRDMIHTLAPDADVVLVVDSDEVWNGDLATFILDGVFNHWPQIQARTYRAPIIHYWRSFYRCILHDPAFPVRIILPKYRSQEMSIGERVAEGIVINHFGYAQRPEIVRYKLETHGHKNEFRRDCDWFTDVFMANRQTDCHPVGSEFWNPETVNPWDYLPEWMKLHPYANLQVIE